MPSASYWFSQDREEIVRQIDTQRMLVQCAEDNLALYPGDERFLALLEQARERVAEYEPSGLAELARRDRAEALPHVPRGKAVRITEDLPDTAASAMPKTGVQGKSEGAGAMPGTTAVRFDQRDLGYIGRRSITVYVPNYAVEVI